MFKKWERPIVAMIWEDNMYGLITWKQMNHFGRHTELSFSNPEFVKLAEVLGWAGQRVETSCDLRGTLARSEQPSLIVIPIDYRENMLLSAGLGQIACPILGYKNVETYLSILSCQSTSLPE